MLVAVSRDLFPLSPRARLTPAAVLATLAALAVLTLASLLRQIGAPALDTLWAEDATIFLSTAYTTPLAEALNATYAGYVHWLPRLVAAAAVSLAPVSHVALVMSLAGAALTALAAVLVYVATAGHIRSVPLRATLASLVVLAPALSFETLNAMTHVQWPLTFACFWLALWRPSRVSASALSAAVVFGTVTTAPPAMALAPLFLARLLLLRRWADQLSTAAFGAGLAVQFAHLTPGQPPGVAAAGTPGQLGEAWATFVAAPALFGFRPITYTAVVHPGLTGELLAAAAAFWLIVVVFALACHWRRLTVLVIAGAAVAIPIAGFWLRGEAVGALRYRELFPAELPLGVRYGVIGALLLASLLVLAADVYPRRARAYAQTAIVAGLALAAGVSMLEPNLRTPGPTLSSQLPAAVQACAGGRDAAEIAATPWLQGLPEPTWRLSVPCDRLDG